MSRNKYNNKIKNQKIEQHPWADKTICDLLRDFKEDFQAISKSDELGLQAMHKAKFNDAQNLLNETLKSYRSIQTKIGAATLPLDHKINESLNTAIGTTYCNIGLCLQNIDLDKAIIYNNNAHEVSPSDQRVIYSQWALYSMCQKYDESIAVAKKLLSPAKQLLILQSQLLSKSITPEEARDQSASFTLNKLTDQERSWKSSLHIYISSALMDIDQLKFWAKYSIRLTNGGSGKSLLNSITLVLQSFAEADLFKNGLDILNENYKNFPDLFKYHTDPELIYYEYIFHELNGEYDIASQKLERLNELKDLSPKCKAVTDRIIKIREWTNIIASMTHIPPAKEDDNNHISQEIANEIMEFSTGEENLENSPPLDYVSSSEDHATKTPSKEEVSIAEDKDSLEEKPIIDEPKLSRASELKDYEIDQERNAVTIKPANLTIKQKYNYAKYKQSELAKKPIHSLQKNEDDHVPSWVIEGRTWSSNHPSIIKVEGRDNYYICAKDDPRLKETMLTAIKKGEVTRKSYSIGIKFCIENNSGIFVEVKIHGGDRAWSKHIYKNENDERLIFIDGYGNHKAAEKAARNPIKIEQVKSDPNILSLIKATGHEATDNNFVESNHSTSEYDYPSWIKEDPTLIGNIKNYAEDES